VVGAGVAGYTQVVARKVFIVRFPDGDLDLHASSAEPAVGDELTKRGRRWVVVRVATDAGGCLGVTLMPADAVHADVENTADLV
jgi:hypothetical protein